MGKAYSTLSTMKSLLTDDLEHCLACGSRATDCHHIYGASNKKWSEEFNLMIPLCHQCHMQMHDEKEQKMNRFYKQLGQEVFQMSFPNLRFQDYFGKNYI